MATTVKEIEDLLKELRRRDEYNRVHSKRDDFDQRLINALEDAKKATPKASLFKSAVTPKPKASK